MITCYEMGLLFLSADYPCCELRNQIALKPKFDTNQTKATIRRFMGNRSF